MPSTIRAANVLGDIVLCEFPFTSGATSKVRPALVLFDLNQDAIICRITSVLHTDPLDVHLRDWRAAGLLKPSVARVNRVVTADKGIFLRKLGRLSEADLEAVRTCWRKYMTL